MKHERNDNALLYEKNITTSVITEVSYNEENLVLFRFKDGSSLQIETSHEQDCCECVFSDTSIFVYHQQKLKDLKVSKIEIKGVEDLGFLVCFNDENKILVGCHNRQNGYYSSELTLNCIYISNTGLKEIKQIDLTDKFVLDDID